jgi:hypothetical protein
MELMNQCTIERQPNLAIYGVHGRPERTGLILKESTDARPVAGWDFMPGDEEAIATGARTGPSGNLALAFPGNILSTIYRERRAAELLISAEGRNCVLEIHDRPTSTGEYAIAHPNCDTQRMLRITKSLGINAIVFAEKEQLLTSHALNGITIEFCRADNKDSERVDKNVERLRNTMHLLFQKTLPEADLAEFQYYELGPEYSAEEAKQLGLQGKDELELAPFDEVPKEILAKLKLQPGEYTVQSWNGINSSEGTYFGGVFKVLSLKLVEQFIKRQAVLH